MPGYAQRHLLDSIIWSTDGACEFGLPVIACSFGQWRSAILTDYWGMTPARLLLLKELTLRYELDVGLGASAKS